MSKKKSDASKASSYISMLPSDLGRRFQKWQTNEFKAKPNLYAQLAQKQTPHSMVISCCDSRVHATTLFEAESGEFFIHRNIANLVPPPQADSDVHLATSAAVEFAVKHLKVAHLIILGHAQCGGIKGGFDLCQNSTESPPENNIAETTFISTWVALIKPAYERLDKTLPRDKQITQLEKISTLVSAENLLAFPFVKHAHEQGRLAIHALWHDFATGDMLAYDAQKDAFVPI